MIVFRPQTRIVCEFCEGYAIVKVVETDNTFTFESCPKKCLNGFSN